MDENDQKAPLLNYQTPVNTPMTVGRAFLWTICLGVFGVGAICCAIPVDVLFNNRQWSYLAIIGVAVAAISLAVLIAVRKYPWAVPAIILLAGIFLYVTALLFINLVTGS